MIGEVQVSVDEGASAFALARKCGLVASFFHIDDWIEQRANHKVRSVARTTGIRSNRFDS
jgi:hypothetical protein